MSAVPQVMPTPIPSSGELIFDYTPCDLENHDEDDSLTIRRVESLKKGIIRTRADPAKASYTILLVGETGVGKSSLLELIANTLHGNDVDHYDLYTLDHSNEQGGSDNQSQTNSVRIYEFTSKNGALVRILDTPGLADTRSIQHDELHKERITDLITKHIDSITAVLVLANGTVPRTTVGTDYALTTLSAIFPKTLANNIGFIFTNVSSPLHWNFSGDTLPDALKGAPQFILNNPIALHRKYNKLKGGPNTRKERAEFRKAVKASEQDALEMMVDLFDWLYGLEQQPATGIAPHYEKDQNHPALSADARAPMHQKPTEYGHSRGLGREPGAHNLEEGQNVTKEQELGQKQPGIIQGSSSLSLFRKAREIMQGGVQRVKQLTL